MSTDMSEKGIELLIVRSLTGLSDAQIALCFQYATEDAPIDFRVMFPGDATSTQPKLARSGAGEEES